jgi:predicted RNase H-like HicB family nuclease
LANCRHDLRNVQLSAFESIFKVIMSPKKPPSSIRSRDLRFQFEIECEADGRWMAEIPEVPGALAYGTSVEEAKAKAYALALYAIADDVEKSRNIPDSISIAPVSA